MTKHETYCVSCGKPFSQCGCTFHVPYGKACPHCGAKGSTWCQCSAVASPTGKHRKCGGCSKCWRDGGSS